MRVRDRDNFIACACQRYRYSSSATRLVTRRWHGHDRHARPSPNQYFTISSKRSVWECMAPRLARTNSNRNRHQTRHVYPIVIVLYEMPFMRRTGIAGRVLFLLRQQNCADVHILCVVRTITFYCKIYYAKLMVLGNATEAVGGNERCDVTAVLYLFPRPYPLAILRANNRNCECD